MDLPQLLEARNGGLQCCRNDSVQSLAARVRFLHSRRADRTAVAAPKVHAQVIVAQPMSCVHEHVEVINPHTVGSLTIPRASIEWV